jgi:hypothetical protein
MPKHKRLSADTPPGAPSLVGNDSDRLLLAEGIYASGHWSGSGNLSRNAVQTLGVRRDSRFIVRRWLSSAASRSRGE